MAKNGFRWPLNLWQVLMWVLQVINVCGVALYVLERGRLFVGCGVALIVVMVAGFLTTHSDPTFVVKEEELYTYECSVCNLGVPNKTKHCGRCNRCVGGFDHHCKILNNCIGESNYTLYIVLIVSFELQEALLAVGSLIMLMSEINQNLYVFSVFLLIISVGVGTVNGYLLGFHIYLNCQKLTTYEYLVLKKANSHVVPTEEIETHRVLTGNKGRPVI